MIVFLKIMDITTIKMKVIFVSNRTLKLIDGILIMLLAGKIKEHFECA
jgi:hypothetical protein